MRDTLRRVQDKLCRALNMLVGRSSRFARFYWRVQGVRDEVGFWDDYLLRRGREWPEDYARRFDPSATIDDPVLTDCVDAVAASRVEILDVGAGPATRIGYTHPDRELSITPVDALADRYSQLLDAHGLVPPVPTLAGRAEGLVDQFGEGRFDVAYGRNSIDHTPDPVRVIEQMLSVVKPGGAVILRHFRNEGEAHVYRGFEQWNFDVGGDGTFLVWNRGVSHNLSERLAGRAEVRAWQEEQGKWVIAVLTPYDGPVGRPGATPGG